MRQPAPARGTPTKEETGKKYIYTFNTNLILILILIPILTFQKSKTFIF
jgi:hypothetical protein